MKSGNTGLNSTALQKCHYKHVIIALYQMSDSIVKMTSGDLFLNNHYLLISCNYTNNM